MIHKESLCTSFSVHSAPVSYRISDLRAAQCYCAELQFRTETKHGLESYSNITIFFARSEAKEFGTLLSELGEKIQAVGFLDFSKKEAPTT
jgi:hypothetical protein